MVKLYNNKYYGIGDYSEQVLSADGASEVGVITRKWLGFIKSVFNIEGAHTFAVTCKQYSLRYVFDCLP